MARSIEQIQAEIITQKELRPELDRLTSSSATAIWRLWVYVVAVAIHIHETLLDIFKKEVDERILSLQPGTPDWYIRKIREFQLGDHLTIIDGVATYPNIDESKRIVTRAAYRDQNDGTLTLKVAKGDIGSESALSAEEVYQLETYLERIKFAGTKINLISLNADRLRLTAEVYFNGLFAKSDVKERVENAIREYLKNLSFDGVLYLNKLNDTIREVDGVLDVYISSAVGMAGTTPTTITRIYDTASGYIVEDTDAGFTFDDLITYTPQNV